MPTRLGKNQRTVLDVLEAERRASPELIREQTNLPKQRVHEALEGLIDRGLVTKRAHALYEVAEEGRGED